MGPSVKSSPRLAPIPPDGGWGWVVVIGSFFIHVIVDGFVYSFGVLVNILIEEFSSDNTMSSFIISLLTGLTLGTGPIAAAICNKYGCRMTTIIGACVAMIGCAASSFAKAMWHIIVAVGIVMGVGVGLMYCPAIVAVTIYFEKRRSLATGLAVSGAGFGTMLFSPINERIISSFGWRAVFHTFVGLLALCSICGLAFRPLPLREVDEDDRAGRLRSVEKPKPVTVQRSATSLNFGKRSNSHEILKETRSLSDIDFSEEEKLTSNRKRSNTFTERDGYLNRMDVFYIRSITNLPDFLEHPASFRSIGSSQMNSAEEIKEKSVQNANRDDTKGKNTFTTVSNMFSLSLLKDPIFLIFAVSNLLTSLGFNSPMLFLPSHAIKSVGLDSAKASMVLSILGFWNTVGRLVFGFVADYELPLPYGLGRDTARNRLWMYIISLSICGLLTTLCYLCTGFTSLSIYAGLFGFLLATYICLTSVVLVDFFGLDKLTNAFGLLLLWQGVGTVAGPVISGFLADTTDSYVWSFVFCGVSLLISGMMLFSTLYFQKKKM